MTADPKAYHILSRWRAMILVPCPLCGAERDKRCRTKSGKVRGSHDARVLLAAMLPAWNAVVDDVPMPVACYPVLSLPPEVKHDPSLDFESLGEDEA